MPNFRNPSVRGTTYDKVPSVLVSSRILHYHPQVKIEEIVRGLEKINNCWTGTKNKNADE